MDRHFHVADNGGKDVASNLADECKKCLGGCDSLGMMIVCPKYGGERRQGVIKNTRGSTFLCTMTKTTKLFRGELESLAYAQSDIVIVKNEIEEGIRKVEQQKVNRLVHNLASINGKNILEIYNLVSQDLLSTNWRSQLEFIEREITNDPKKAAILFLKIAKNNIQMKSEFSIYKRLDRADTKTLEIKSNRLRALLLNVLHPFFVDFNDNRIYVSVNEYIGRCMFDYETIQVCFYHFFENATKYVKPNTAMEISFEESDNFVKVIFSMTSAYIKPIERESIFNEGISGETAQAMRKQGDGIGLWRMRQIMELNNGRCELIAGDEPIVYHGFEYAYNTFTLSFVRDDVSRRRTI